MIKFKIIVAITFVLYSRLLIASDVTKAADEETKINIHQKLIVQCYNKITEAKNVNPQIDIKLDLEKLKYAQVSTSDFFAIYVVLIDSYRSTLSRDYYFTKKIELKKKTGRLERLPEVVCFFSRRSNNVLSLAQWARHTFFWESEKQEKHQDDLLSLDQFIKKLGYKSYPLYRFFYKK